MNTVFYLHALVLRLRQDKSGATATEYAFLIAFIAIAAAALGMTLLINSWARSSTTSAPSSIMPAVQFQLCRADPSAGNRSQRTRPESAAF